MDTNNLQPHCCRGIRVSAQARKIRVVAKFREPVRCGSRTKIGVCSAGTLGAARKTRSRQTPTLQARPTGKDFNPSSKL